MNRDTMEAFAAWGDRANRDTGHLLDIVAAGVIDQLQGHGTVILRPARLEEIVSRIGLRTRDADGGWVVTLLPDPTETKDDIKARDERTSAEIASLAGRILALEEIGSSATREAYNELLADAKRLAGSALTQRG